MNDKLLQWTRFAVATILGAWLTVLVKNLGITEENAKDFAAAIQTVVTILLYVGLTKAADRYPLINRILSLFLSSDGPKYSDSK